MALADAWSLLGVNICSLAAFTDWIWHKRLNPMGMMPSNHSYTLHTSKWLDGWSSV